MMALHQVNVTYVLEQDPARALQQYRWRMAAEPQHRAHAPLAEHGAESDGAASVEVRPQLSVPAVCLHMQNCSSSLCRSMRRQWETLDLLPRSGTLMHTCKPLFIR